MDEIRKLLEAVDRCYPDFVNYICRKVKKNPDIESTLLQYLKAHPESKTDDILEYVTEELLSDSDTK